MNSILQDFRDATRGLLKTPGFTAAVVVTLALGIGANTAIFSLVNSLLLKTLPVRDPQQLALLDPGSWSNPVWEQIRDRQDALFNGAFAWSAERFNLSDTSQTDFVDGVYASGRIFDVLGVKASLGRTFTESDDAKDGGPDRGVVVISHNLWQQRFRGAPDVLGRQLHVNRVQFTIVGVAPQGFFGPDVGRSSELFVPLRNEALIRGAGTFLDGRTTGWLNIIARLRSNQTIDQANALLASAQSQIREATDADYSDYLKEPLTFVSAANGRSPMRSRYLDPLVIIMAVAGAVLFIACANIATLLLARASARRHELVLRLALGASRLRLARGMLVEALLLGAFGACLGLIVSRVVSSLLILQISSRFNQVVLDTSLDWRVVVFTAGVACATALLFGLAPVLALRQVFPNEALKEHGRGVAGDRRFGFRSALVVLQVGLSLVLIVAAGVFGRTFAALSAVPLGFDPAPLVLIDANLEQSRLADEQRARLLEQFRTAAMLPGVASAAVSTMRPVSGQAWNTVVDVPGGPKLSGRARMAWLNAVSPDWFATYRIRMLSGRAITASDLRGGPAVAVVSQAFARRFLPGQDPVGHEIVEEGPSVQQVYRIVGVVNDIVYRQLREGVLPSMYVSIAQLAADGGPQFLRSATIAVRAHAAPGAALVTKLVEALGRVDSTTSFTVRPFDDQIRASIAQERLIAWLSGLFGALALLLAAIGLYGVTSYSVSLRRGEIGIRMALGAGSAQTVRLVVLRAVGLLAAGIAAGSLLTWWATRFIAPSLVFGLDVRDPGTFLIAVLVLAVIGAVAGWLPARRAARIDPAQVLREA